MEFDGLILLSSFELRSRHPHFGGISGLSIGADGRLYAVSDRGYWLSARMRHDSEGALIDLLDWQIKPILTPERTPTDGLLTDAEALARAPDGWLIIGFEQKHRLVAVSAASPDLRLTGAANHRATRSCQSAAQRRS